MNDLRDSSETCEIGTALANIVETISESISTLTNSALMMNAVRNGNERTHFIRYVRMRSYYHRKTPIALFSHLATALACRNKSLVLELVTAGLQEWTKEMPVLVRDGLSEVYQSAQTVSPSVLTRLLSAP